METKTFTLEEWLHRERKAIDRLIQEIKIVADERHVKGGAEITLSFRALQMAKMWLGQALGEISKPLPPEFADKAESSESTIEDEYKTLLHKIKGD